VAAWVEWTTEGTIVDAMAVGSRLFVVTRRGGETATVRVEALDPDAIFDCEVTVSGAASTSWAGFSALAGRTVHHTADGLYMGLTTVSAGGVITLGAAASTVVAGFLPDWEVEPMPIDTVGGSVTGKQHRIVKLTAKLRGWAGIKAGAVSYANLAETEANATREIDHIPLGWNRDPRVSLTRFGPFPVQLQALMIEAAVGS
jgi:hypothetical protein